jgi:hypothetical protein
MRITYWNKKLNEKAKQLGWELEFYYLKGDPKNIYRIGMRHSLGSVPDNIAQRWLSHSVDQNPINKLALRAISRIHKLTV